MTITDEMVEKAYYAICTYPDGRNVEHWDTPDMRRALEAVAPLLIAPYKRELDACNGALANSGAAYALALADRNKLIAQGLREAADICYNLEKGGSDAQAAILARAQELDPK